MSRKKVANAKIAEREIVGERLKAIRAAHGLSQKDVADLAGHSPSLISEIESGKKGITIKILLALENFGIHMRDVVGDLSGEGLPPIKMVDAFKEPPHDPAKTPANSVAERLRSIIQLLELHGIRGLADATGVRAGELAKILESDTIDEETARRIAAALHYEYLWILRGEGPPQLPGAEIQGYQGFDSTEAAEMIQPATKPAPKRPQGEFVYVPKARTRLSAGGGIVAEEGNQAERYAFRQDWLRSEATSPNNVVLLDVDGDSMDPEYRNGDTVLVDIGRNEFRDGRVFAISVGGVIQLKRLEMVARGRIRIVSLNPGFHSYETDLHEFRIIGEPIWLGRPLQ